MSNHEYIAYSEVFGHKASEDELNGLNSSSSKAAAFRHLSMINNFLALFPADFDEAKYVYVQRLLSVNLLDPAIYERLRTYVENIPLVDRPIFLQSAGFISDEKILARRFRLRRI